MTKSKRCSPDDINSLMGKFVQKAGEGHVFARQSTVEKISSDDSKIVTLSYLDMCARFRMEPDNFEANSKRVEAYVKCGWLAKKK